VDNDWFSGEAAKARLVRAQLRRAWGIPAESIVFLFVGKFQDYKRPMDVLLAAKRLVAQGLTVNQFLILMVGDGVLRRPCEAYARDHSLPVVFKGFMNQSQLPSAYAVSDTLILPSNGHETWGLVVNEAMACGLAAIVSNEVGCGPDLILEARTGFVYPIGNIHALSGAMRRLLSSGERTRMGDNARRHVASYSVKSAAGVLVEAVESIHRG